ncbi:16S rRNA (uracil(1498)-N(3))-methyltransferase [Spongiimicrobium salis]|uniref:16S rRNA (uracil(1498)-N(3))-methyltransferase n=1 Tax=Spongiimicrobium salis TaxID=1667022 RepID=UPI00374DA5D2
MQLFYSPEIQPGDSEFTFSSEESKHIVRVLRKKENDIVHITDGKGHLFEAVIMVADAKRCSIKILQLEQQKGKDYRLHLVVAPTKMNDRFEWFLEKATEIGVHEITPVICDHSERKVIKMARMEKVVQTAMKQSLRTFLPQLNPPIAFSAFMALPHTGQLFIAHCEEGNKKELKNQLSSQSEGTILIGPEGDFSSKEITLALEKGFVPVSLGEHRLRTETAAIVACTTASFVNMSS